MSDNSEILKGVRIGSIIVWTITGLICLGMWGCPRYNVYSSEMNGKAEYKEAEQNRKIVVEEAEAENEAAISIANTKIILAEAANEAMIIEAQGIRASDSIRAIGIAAANEIIGQSLEGNTDYLHFLWIDQLSKGGQKVYIPTEANLPILEAKRSK
jgi:hypothetical protein